jgi:RNA polymerase sigma-70 factor (family 1)
MQQDDNDIIRRFNQGSTQAFTAIYNQYYPTLHYFVRRFIHDPEDAEDITADIFIRLWKIRTRFDSVQNIKAFLYITARNACIDFLRHRERMNENQEKMSYLLRQQPDDAFPQDDLWAEVLTYIYQEIEKLPGSCRKVFKMAYLEGLSNNEISQTLHINPQSVYNYKQRALKLLRLALLRKNILAIVLFCYSIVNLFLHFS